MIRGFDASRVRGICFDLDGTLVDTDDAYVLRLASWLALPARLWPGANPDIIARRLVMGLESPANLWMHWQDRLGLDEWLGPLLESARPRGRQPPDLICGVRRLLAALAPRFPLALVSSRDQASTRHILRTHGIEQVFQSVATARTCRRTKPYPDPVLWAVGQLRLPPSACLMVGDTTVDIRAGRSAGLQTAGVLCGFGERAEIERAGADLILGSTAELSRVMLDQQPACPPSG
jgi:N-acetyl-D-muramate 6-phosphate phosphatase